jgi:hypothetical protein
MTVSLSKSTGRADVNPCPEPWNTDRSIRDPHPSLYWESYLQNSGIKSIEMLAARQAGDQCTEIYTKEKSSGVQHRTFFYMASPYPNGHGDERFFLQKMRLSTGTYALTAYHVIPFVSATSSITPGGLDTD